MSTIFETERLLLKILEPSDTGNLLEYFLRNRSFLKEWEAIKPKDFYTLKFQNDYIKCDFDAIQAGNLFRFWMIKKSDSETGRIIGSVGFSNIVRGAFYSCFLGYRLDKDEINKGYMTEAIKKGIEIMFNEYSLHRIEANIMPKNKASLRVVEKLGFYNEGLAKKYLNINGQWEDHIHMVLRNESLE